MWNNTEIEDIFLSIAGQQNTYWINYQTIKNHFCQNGYSLISIAEPNLTDHSATHIENVLRNVHKLLQSNSLSVVELYILCSAILIHDIGNLSGRQGHEINLKDYFKADTFPSIHRDDIVLISQIASKHGGTDCDTINSLPDTMHLDGEKIRGRKIASLVRFADELAEGKQRTSQILLTSNLIDKDSKLYHHYADILKQPVISNDAILLEYNICLCKYNSKDLLPLLNLIFKRIKKLDKERIYCGHYCDDIQKIKKVTISINFYKDEHDFNPISFQNNSLVNFELSGKNIHCDEQNKNTDMVQEIIKEIANIQQVNAGLEPRDVSFFEKIQKWWSAK